MQTEQQQIIETTLFMLLDRYKGMISIEFRRAREHEVSYAERGINSVRLYLFEPKDQNDLSEWDKAIQQAGNLLWLLSEEIEHEKASPNFFRAIAAKYESVIK